MPTMPPPDSFIKVEVMRAELTAPPEDLLSLPSVLSGSANTRVAISTGNGAATTQNKAAGGEAITWAETFALPFFSGKVGPLRRREVQRWRGRRAPGRGDAPRG